MPTPGLAHAGPFDRLGPRRGLFLGIFRTLGSTIPVVQRELIAQRREQMMFDRPIGPFAEPSACVLAIPRRPLEQQPETSERQPRGAEIGGQVDAHPEQVDLDCIPVLGYFVEDANDSPTESAP